VGGLYLGLHIVSTIGADGEEHGADCYGPHCYELSEITVTNASKVASVVCTLAPLSCHRHKK
jgi:hypothetical protein